MGEHPFQKDTMGGISIISLDGGSDFFISFRQVFFEVDMASKEEPGLQLFFSGQFRYPQTDQKEKFE